MPDDLIPRSKAIEALKAAKEKGNIFLTLDPEKKPEKTPHAFVILKKALDAIDAIPAVDPNEPWNRGHWIMVDEYCNHAKEFQCSSCENTVEYDHYTRFCEYDICPHCGAIMDEEVEE